MAGIIPRWTRPRPLPRAGFASHRSISANVEDRSGHPVRRLYTWRADVLGSRQPLAAERDMRLTIDRLQQETGSFTRFGLLFPAWDAAPILRWGGRDLDWSAALPGHALIASTQWRNRTAGRRQPVAAVRCRSRSVADHMFSPSPRPGTSLLSSMPGKNSAPASRCQILNHCRELMQQHPEYHVIFDSPETLRRTLLLARVRRNQPLPSP